MPLTKRAEHSQAWIVLVLGKGQYNYQVYGEKSLQQNLFMRGDTIMNKHKFQKAVFCIFLLACMFVFSGTVTAYENAVIPDLNVEGDGAIVPFDAWLSKVEYGQEKTVFVGGYAGGQPSGGTRFPTGGGFFWSDSGGPITSASVNYSVPFTNVSLSVYLGNVGTSGSFTNAPNTTDYFKLYITKEYKVKPYIIYRRQYAFQDWQVYLHGSDKTCVRNTAAAIKQ